MDGAVWPLPAISSNRAKRLPRQQRRGLPTEDLAIRIRQGAGPWPQSLGRRQHAAIGPKALPRRLHGRHVGRLNPYAEGATAPGAAVNKLNITPQTLGETAS